MPGQFCKNFQFYSTQKCLGSPETESDLENQIGSRMLHCCRFSHVSLRPVIMQGGMLLVQAHSVRPTAYNLKTMFLPRLVPALICFGLLAQTPLVFRIQPLRPVEELRRESASHTPPRAVSY